MSRLQSAVIGGVRRIVGRVPERWLPGANPDPLIERRAALGTQEPRVDGADKLRGTARFAAEVPMEGLLHAAFVHSTIPRGRIEALDTAAAEAAPGVALVMTHRNAPKMAVPPGIGLTNPKGAGNNLLPVLQDAEVRWNGQVVAVVLAESREEADHAATLIAPRYAPAPARTRFEDGKADAISPGLLMFEPNEVTVGKPDEALAAAPFRVEAAYRTPWEMHAPIEPHATTLRWEDGRLVVHDATQMLHGTAATLAKVFGLSERDVRVHSPFVGGGFGAKAFWDHQILAAAAAKLAGRPVRVTLTRKAMARLIGGRSRTDQRVALGADRDGRLTAMIHTGHAFRPAHGVTEESFSMSGRKLYAPGAARFGQKRVGLDLLANSFMRAPGEAPGSFAVECAMDELAHRIGMDPVELRRRNLADRDPLSGAPHSQNATMEAFSMGAERIGWADRPAVPGTRREGEWRLGLGCAAGAFPYLRLPGVAVRIDLHSDGTATVSSAAHEMGMGTATVQRQHAADRLGLPVDRVTVRIGDSSLPFGGMAGGSAQTASLGAAIQSAAGKLAQELLRLAGNDTPLAGLRAAEVEFAGGNLRATEDPARRESVASILRRAGRETVSVTGESGAPLEMLKFAMHSTSAVFCALRVSDVTGEVRVDRMVGAFDVGRILNPRTAASQLRGGMVMGLGMALTEEVMLDERSGRMMGTSLADYHVPAHLDVPKIDVLWTDIPDPRAPMGARGIGEIGTTGVAAAVANAVFNATGKRLRDLPLTPDKVLMAEPLDA